MAQPTPRWVWWVAGTGLGLLLLRLFGKPAVTRGLLVSYPATIPRGGQYKFLRDDGRVHRGIDIFAPEGTAVAAAERGRVEYVGVISGYGEVVVINHPQGVRTLYAHLSKQYVGVGQDVAQNDLVGAVGRTANDPDGCGRYFCTSKPHLHFEVITDDGPVNRSRTRTSPLAWLADVGMAPYEAPAYA